MTPLVQKTSGPDPGPGFHAHLLVEETGGRVAMESPEAVMEEVEFRTSHISLLMEKMFEESREHDFGELTED
jgi:hypothetical protein